MNYSETKLLTAISLKPMCDMYALPSKVFAITAVPKKLTVFTFERINLKNQFLLS